MGKRARGEMELVFVGAGMLATQLAQALHEKGHHILAVYSRTMASAQALAVQVGAIATDDIATLPYPTADAIIMAVKDDALPSLATQLAAVGDASGRCNLSCPVFHTAGSVPADTLGTLAHYGVIYPMQTFSKERRADFARIPVFIEASDDETLAVARDIATSVSSQVTMLNSERRRQLHLAAVFACNFVNHCYALSADILERSGLDFSVMLPLVEETAAKVATMQPREAQTGPAVRYDQTVIARQSEMLAAQPLTRQIYELMSNSIHQHAVSNASTAQLPNPSTT